ncbi:hypothetical protein H4219_002211 [Mycoemilia scoparia]|uniref:Protein ARV n=1 Tax=Mycoemilia scoparia TaxID=417184 RepID=A0A9W8DUC5_9FUNG|nr:hypothetical protein H4219_002211 [Mycoemilia scoparia]
MSTYHGSALNKEAAKEARKTFSSIHPPHTSWRAISMATVLSNFGKIMMILLVIWDYDEPYYPWLLSTLTFSSHSTAVSGKRNSILAYIQVPSNSICSRVLTNHNLLAIIIALLDINVVRSGLTVLFGMALQQLVHGLLVHIFQIVF